MKNLFKKTLAVSSALALLAAGTVFADSAITPRTTEHIENDGAIMVPLRVNAEYFGYEVAWDEATQGVTVTQGAQYATLNIGVDEYGMSKCIPVPLGAAPILVNDSATYVPIEFFTQILDFNLKESEGEFIFSLPNYVTLTDFEEDGALVVEDENLGTVIVRIDENTEITADGLPYSADKLEKLEKGQLLDIEYSGMMTRSIPPQTTAVSIDIQNLPVEAAPAAEVTVKSVNEDGSLTVDDKNIGEVIVYITDETVVLKDNTPVADKVEYKEGQELSIVYSEAMTMSLPPQTTAVEITLK